MENSKEQFVRILLEKWFNNHKQMEAIEVEEFRNHGISFSCKNNWSVENDRTWNYLNKECLSIESAFNSVVQSKEMKDRWKKQYPNSRYIPSVLSWNNLQTLDFIHYDDHELVFDLDEFINFAMKNYAI